MARIMQIKRFYQFYSNDVVDEANKFIKETIGENLIKIDYGFNEEGSLYNIVLTYWSGEKTDNSDFDSYTESFMDSDAFTFAQKIHVDKCRLVGAIHLYNRTHDTKLTVRDVCVFGFRIRGIGKKAYQRFISEVEKKVSLEAQ